MESIYVFIFIYWPNYFVYVNLVLHGSILKWQNETFRSHWKFTCRNHPFSNDLGLQIYYRIQIQSDTFYLFIKGNRRKNEKLNTLNLQKSTLFVQKIICNVSFKLKFKACKKNCAVSILYSKGGLIFVVFVPMYRLKMKIYRVYLIYLVQGSYKKNRFPSDSNGSIEK